MKKTAIILVAAIIFGCTSAYAADSFTAIRTYEYRQFTDIDESAWYGVDNLGVIKTIYECGIMDGIGNSSFLPENSVQICEAIKIASVIHNIYSGSMYKFEPSEPWYTPYIDYAVNSGIIQEDDFDDYTSFATRSELAHIFANCTDDEQLAAVNTVNGIVDVEHNQEYRQDILKLYRAGIITGFDEMHRFFPNKPITRAETAAIAARIIDKSDRCSLEILSDEGDTSLHDTFGIYNEAGYRLSCGYQSKENLETFLSTTNAEIIRHEIDYSYGENTTMVMIEADGNYGVITYLENTPPSGYIYIGKVTTLNAGQYADRDIHIGDPVSKLFDVFPFESDTYTVNYSEIPLQPTYAFVYNTTDGCAAMHVVCRHDYEYDIDDYSHDVIEEILLF